MPDDLNPYEPPTASLERPDPADVDARALALRRNNRGHEAAFRALGSVNFLGAVLDMAFIAVASAHTLTPDEVRSGVSSRGETLWLVYLFIVMPAFLLLHVFIAIGLRHFWIWAFRGQVILSSAAIASFFKNWAIGWDNQPYADFSIVTAVLSAIAHFAILVLSAGVEGPADYRSGLPAGGCRDTRSPGPSELVPRRRHRPVVNRLGMGPDQRHQRLQTTRRLDLLLSQ
jgi:hypothetical protein